MRTKLLATLVLGALVLVVFGGLLVAVVVYSDIDSHIRAGVAGGLVSALSAYISIVGSTVHSLLARAERHTDE